MILNSFTVLALFLAAVGCLLSLAACAITVWRSFVRPGPTGDTLAQENLGHLLLLVLGTLTMVRLIAWPHFYATLKSYVPELSAFGVMCVYGVTRTQPALIGLLQWSKPIVLWCLGLWLVLHSVERPAWTSWRLLGTFLVAVLALADCNLELVCLIRESPGQRVTCCTQFIETEVESAAHSTDLASSLGPNIVGVFSTAHWILTAGLLVLCFFPVGFLLVPGRLSRVVGLALVGFIGLFHLFLGYWTWKYFLAPRVLQLPYHFCIYELITDTLAMGLAAALLVGGSTCLLWPLALEIRQPSNPEQVARLQECIYKFCGLALLSQLVIVGIHIP